jgi:hypothetical protein
MIGIVSEQIQGEQQSPYRRRAIIVALALLAYAWTLGLHFQFDDFWLIPGASAQLEWLSEAFAHDTAPPAPFDHLFQPVLWLWTMLDRWISGEPYQPWVFHLSSMLMHALTALLLLRVLERHYHARAALLATALFAISPIGAQAVSWTAGRGDMLWCTFALLALLALPRRAWLAGLWLALAFGAKSSGWMALPLVAVYLWKRSNLSWLGRAKQLPWLVVPLLLVAGLRAAYVETWSLVYIGQLRAQPEQLPSVLAALPKALGYALAPENPPGSTWASLLPAYWLALCGWGLVAGSFLLVLLKRPRRQFGRLITALGCLALPLLPASFLWHFAAEPLGVTHSRSLYGVGMALALFVAMSLDCVQAPQALLRKLTLLGVALLALLQLDAMQHVARLELAAASSVRARIASLQELAGEHEREITFVAEDPELLQDGVHMTQTQLPTALRPPFSGSIVPVVHCMSIQDLLRENKLERLTGEVQLLRLDGERFAPIGPILPPVLGAVPELEKAPGSGPDDVGTWWTPRGLTTRELSRLTVRSSSPSGRVQVVLHCESGEATTDRRLHSTASGTRAANAHEHVYEAELSPSEGGGRFRIDLRADWRFSAAGRLSAITLRWIEKPEDPAATLEPSLAFEGLELRIQAPAAGTVLPLETRPEFRIEGLPPGADLELEFALELFGARQPFVYLVPAERVRRDGATALYRPELADFQGQDGLPWEQSMQLLYRNFAQAYGIQELRLHARAYAREDGLRIGRSEPASWTLRPH